MVKTIIDDEVNGGSLTGIEEEINIGEKMTSRRWLTESIELYKDEKARGK